MPLDESAFERSPEYWGKLEASVRGDLAMREAELKQALNIEPERDLLKLLITTDGKKTFPSVTLTSGGLIAVSFPIDYFVYMENAAKFMNLDFAYRQALALGSTFPEDDLSAHFHMMWSQWILRHEIGHAVCGHLGSAANEEFMEYPAVEEGATQGCGLPFRLRRVLEIDADAFAAQTTFRAYGRMTIKKYWDDLYHRKDAATLAMQDIALIMWPLFLELDHAGPDVPTTHPTPFERLIVMQVLGFEAYMEEVGPEGRMHLSSYMAALKEAILRSARLEGSMLYRQRPPMDLVSYWHELVAVGMFKRRWAPIRGDWLAKTPNADRSITAERPEGSH